jgi:hypothetical protein
LTFESGSKLTRIGGCAFYNCSSLESIQIPRSIKELRNGWTDYSSLRQVVFESALSLRRMMETSKVALSESHEIRFVECDCALDFPGYSVQTVHGANDVFRLVKIPNEARGCQIWHARDDDLVWTTIALQHHQNTAVILVSDSRDMITSKGRY